MNKQLERELLRLKVDRLKEEADSEFRQNRMEVLWRDIKSGDMKSEITTKILAKDELVSSLVELTNLQEEQITFLRGFRRDREIGDEESVLAAMHLNRKGSKEAYEDKRRASSGDVGEIEWWFGGDAHSVLPASIQQKLGLALYQRELGISPCLDELFAGHSVNMLKLQALFGMPRKRFPLQLSSFRTGRERRYDYRTLASIMDALLGQHLRPRKASVQGRPPKKWLSDPELRTRVLTGIQTRINSLPVPQYIRAAFASVICRYLPESGKNRGTGA